MECIIKEVVQLDRSGICPFAGAKCDGTMKINWQRQFALLPESKVCLSQGQHPTFIEVPKEELALVQEGAAVLMVRTPAGGTCFIKAQE